MTLLWLTLLVFILCDARLNAWLERHYGINHTVNAAYRCLFIGLMIWVFKLDLWQGIFFAVASLFWIWLLFNPLLNFLRTPRKPLLYVGNGKTGSKLDIIEFNYQVPILFLKALMSVSATVFFYYHPW